MPVALCRNLDSEVALPAEPCLLCDPTVAAVPDADASDGGGGSAFLLCKAAPSAEFSRGSRGGTAFGRRTAFGAAFPPGAAPGGLGEDTSLGDLPAAWPGGELSRDLDRSPGDAFADGDCDALGLGTGSLPGSSADDSPDSLGLGMGPFAGAFADDFAVERGSGSGLSNSAVESSLGGSADGAASDVGFVELPASDALGLGSIAADALGGPRGLTLSGVFGSGEDGAAFACLGVASSGAALGDAGAFAEVESFDTGSGKSRSFSSAGCSLFPFPFAFSLPIGCPDSSFAAITYPSVRRRYEKRKKTSGGTRRTHAPKQIQSASFVVVNQDPTTESPTMEMVVSMSVTVMWPVEMAPIPSTAATLLATFGPSVLEERSPEVTALATLALSEVMVAWTATEPAISTRFTCLGCIPWPASEAIALFTCPSSKAQRLGLATRRLYSTFCNFMERDTVANASLDVVDVVVLVPLAASVSIRVVEPPAKEARRPLPPRCPATDIVEGAVVVVQLVVRVLVVLVVLVLVVLVDVEVVVNVVV